MKLRAPFYTDSSVIAMAFFQLQLFGRSGSTIKQPPAASGKKDHQMIIRNVPVLGERSAAGIKWEGWGQGCDHGKEPEKEAHRVERNKPIRPDRICFMSDVKLVLVPECLGMGVKWNPVS